MSEILWPEGFIPGYADNFCSNEVIVTGLTPEDVWPWLIAPARWPTYYANSSDPHIHGEIGPELRQGTRFAFKTFGFPVEALVVECMPPIRGRSARLAWHGWAGEPASPERLDVHHAWLIEALPGGRLRILTQETQNGEPAKVLARQTPNPMINGHQAWLDGLVAAAKGA